MFHARTPARAGLCAALALSMVTLLAGCPDDPYDADTWIKKLDDKAEIERAINELGRLKDPKSIKPLGDAWRRNNHPARIVRVVIDIADQYDRGTVTPDDPKYEGVKERFEADQKRTYGPYYTKGPFWEPAIPYLEEAVTLFLEDDTNSRLIENAIAAADALGRAKSFNAAPNVDVLIKAAVADVPLNSKGVDVRIAALRALGNWKDDDRAIDTLIQVVNSQPDIPEDTEPDKAAEQLVQFLRVYASAADALGDTKSEKGVEPLIRALYEMPAVYRFARQSLVAIGTPAIKPLMDVFAGKHKEMNAFAKEHKFANKCFDPKSPDNFIGGPKTDCVAPKALETKAANLLGDMLAREAIPMMLEELTGQPALPSGFAPDGRPFSFQHSSILLAVRKMGANDKVADAVLAYVKNPKSDDNLVPLAIDTYSFVTDSTSQLGYLENLMSGSNDRTGAKETEADPNDPMLVVAGIAYSRLADKKENLKPFTAQISKYKKVADEWEKKFEAANKTFEKINPGFITDKEAYLVKVKEARLAWEKKNEALKKSNEKAFNKEKDKKPWFESIPKKEREEYKAKKTKFEAAEFAKNDAENKMNEARGSQRTAEQNMARILVGIQCKDKPECLMNFAKKTAAEVADALEKDIPDATKWTDEQKQILWVAAMERALIDLTKLGAKARSVTPDLLTLMHSTERIVREGALLALPNVAELPCEECVKHLDQIIKDDGSQTTLDALTAEARVWRNYYSWAGK